MRALSTRDEARIRYERIQKLRSDGLELWAIAERMGLSEQQVVYLEQGYRRVRRDRAKRERKAS